MPPLRDQPRSAGGAPIGDAPQPVVAWARTLRVGVTGHRLGRLAGADLTELSAAAREVLAAFRAAAPPDAPLHLVSSLADGADSIVAEAATASGWRLDAVLPMPRERYEQDFAPGASRDHHRRLVEAAAAVLELPAPDADDAERVEAYERAGRIVLAQSDVLIGVWDGKTSRGRGGAAQIIAEAVLQGIPVVHIDPKDTGRVRLLWDGLAEHDFGQQSVDTVARGSLSDLPLLVARLTERPRDPIGDRLVEEVDRPRRAARPRSAFAYPLLLGVMGVRRLRWTDLAGPRGGSDGVGAAGDFCSGSRHDHACRNLGEWFGRADADAVVAGQRFRSSYVVSYAMAAIAVVASLAALALPLSVKPLLALIELAAIGTILVLVHRGRRAHLHRRWLDQRHLAERLRCLMVTTRLGDLGLRRRGAVQGSWVTWVIHGAARMTGLPSTRIDDAYLARFKETLLALLDDQLAYLRLDARRMHALEHRLHRLGTLLFGMTALICVGAVLFEVVALATKSEALHHWTEPLGTAATIAGAALPACGAAIYGIRMQGEFAGAAERSATLAERLATLRAALVKDRPDFDTLWRRALRATDLLTEDVSTWLHTYRARPLTLPG